VAWKDAPGSTPTGSNPRDSSWPESVEGAEREEILGYFNERFGLGPDLFEGSNIFKRGRTFWLAHASEHLRDIRDLDVVTVGLPFLRLVRGRLKPTTRGLQLLGSKATRSVADVSKKDIERFLAGEKIAPPEETTPGYAVVRYRGYVLGCGLIMKGKKGEGAALVSQIPKSVPLGGLLDPE
jgi:NOL1/NOP2/fmu family ribosome biogenesis protein